LPELAWEVHSFARGLQCAIALVVVASVYLRFDLFLAIISYPGSTDAGSDETGEIEGKMKGVVLAGGTGSRLNPLTRVTNKHLLPIYDKPMVYYPIQTLVNAGIEEILLVTGGKNAGDFLRLLGNGRDFGLKHLNYTYQEGEGGIAEALGLAEFFAGDDSMCVILGDNIIENNVRHAVEAFKAQKGGAKILLKEVDDAQRFGVAEIHGQHVVGIEEKPKAPKSNFAVVGIYFYDKSVFEKIRRLKPSGRGELEITDVNNFYIDEDKLTYEVLDGWWTDAGTFESLLRANALVAETGANKMNRSSGAGRREVVR
jgi:glucose-1-phosphate thymidylyltransferase